MANWSHTISKNNEAGRSFANNLGYAILNCGAIETLTYSFAAAIQGKHLFETNLSNKSFTTRKKIVISRLQEANLTGDLRNHAIELWEETDKVMKRRNLIAHNPISHIKINREHGEEEQLWAVIDMACSTPTDIVSLDATKLANLANLADNLSQRLSDCLGKIQSELSDNSDT